MTTTMTPLGRPTATVDRPTPTTSAVLHGRHPLRGYAVTWRLTPVSSRWPGGAVTFVVERADGVIDDDLVWQLAEKESVVMTTAEACDLVRRVSLAH
jgi:hypothetical protein